MTSDIRWTLTGWSTLLIFFVNSHIYFSLANENCPLKYDQLFNGNRDSPIISNRFKNTERIWMSGWSAAKYLQRFKR